MNASGTEQVFRLPDLGEGLTEAEILHWRVAVGDLVDDRPDRRGRRDRQGRGRRPSPIAGTVVRLHGEPGSVVDVGAPLIAVSSQDETYREEERAGSGNVLIGYGTSETPRSRRRAARARTREAARPAPGEAVRPAQAVRPTSPETVHPAQAARPAQAEAVRPTPPEAVRPASPEAVRPASSEAPRVISPVVRRLARAHSIDVAALTPSGPGGVVLRRDIEAAVAATTPANGNGNGHAHAPAEAPDDENTRIPLRGVRRAVAEKLSRSRREIPDATTWVDVDATGLLELKKEINEGGTRVGTLALFGRICVAALRKYPDLNAYVDTEREEIMQVRRVHLGFAAQTDRGLVVPVVHGADALTLAELSDRLRERTADAREGRLKPQDLTGGTFTLNNYGGFGVDGSTPIINHPEAAMLGVGRIFERPWGVDGEIRLRPITQLSLTFDHRVCDGGVAGGFLRFVADCVERPATLVANL